MHPERNSWQRTTPATSFVMPPNEAQLLGALPGQDGEAGTTLEIEWKRKDGTTLKVRLSGREVSNEGEMGSYEIIVEDVTQQRKLEDHLRQAGSQGSSDRDWPTTAIWWKPLTARSSVPSARHVSSLFCSSTWTG